ncbi:ATPase [Echinicola pacifica]|uniref:ATPase n=1 Tax=Echinicola pacifica TaxID=346377 RepID=A0A918UV06_9BACT|nr:AAA family ATPase [Echinicola pacifica]GGZ37509.1 ATPase [Echinicola pacifica]
MVSLKEVEKLKSMKDSNVFKKHIEYIRFPLFRNLEPNTLINFDYPISFFVGKNGGGKSSTLQALYGCPLNHSLSDFWFSTAIDPINELKNNRNCFIYGYKEDGEIIEVLKQRAQRKNKLDYWEPSRPVKKYNMDTSTRFSPIERNVEYIDFRSELSAFDSFMYFMPFHSSSSINSKQDYVRRYSSRIKEAFDTGKEIKHFRTIKNKPVVKLTISEIDSISYVLGKKYNEIEILDHKFLKNWGFSVRFSSPVLQYSEAFAGSGETAIIVLIHKIHSCPKNSLVLLDEPETSLHPGSQIRLMSYLIEQCKKKHLQIIISTHSPFFLEKMPSNSIKVFSTNNIGMFHVENKREPKEALYELEIDISHDKTQILMEDSLAYNIIERVLAKMGEDIKNSFELKYLPGGADSLKQRIATLLDFERLPYIIFDGDQKKIEHHVDLSLLPNNEIDTSIKLKTLLKTQTNCSIDFYVDGGNNDNEPQKIELLKKYFKYYEERVFYLPENIPEEIIWDDDKANEKLKSFQKKETNLDENIKNGDAKDYFINLCEALYGDRKHLETLQIEFIINWINKGDNNLSFIEEALNSIRQHASL